MRKFKSVNDKYVDKYLIEEQEEEEKEKNRVWLLLMFFVVILVVATIGCSYSVYIYTKGGSSGDVEIGTVSLTYTEGNTGIALMDAKPMNDEVGKALTGTNQKFDFTIQATLSKAMDVEYEISAVKQNNNSGLPQLREDEVKLYLERAVDPDSDYHMTLAPTHFTPLDNPSEIGAPGGAMILEKGKFTEEGTTIHRYRLRMWIDENAHLDSTPKRFAVRVNVYARHKVKEEG